MKKRGKLSFVFLAFILIILSTSLVFVQGEESAKTGENRVIKDLSSLGSGLLDIGTSISSQVFGDTPSGQYLFAKVLFFVILLAIIWNVLMRIDFLSEHDWVVNIISIASSILAVRWIGGKDVIDMVILPSTTLGIAISAGIPFVLYFFLVNKGFEGLENRIFRRIAWIFFAVIFLGLWWTRDVGSGAESTFALYLYPLTALIALLFAVFDGTISKLIGDMKSDKLLASSRSALIDSLKRDLSDIDEDFTKGRINALDYKKKIHNIKKKIQALSS